MNELWGLLAEETRQSFSNLQNLVLALDSKASTILAIDAILLTAFTLIPNVTSLNLVYRIIIFLPLLISVVFAIACLYLRDWDIIEGEKLLETYEHVSNIDDVVKDIVETRACHETKLLEIQKKKSRLLHYSMFSTIGAFIIGLIFFIFHFLRP
jgi:hypothetical protein